MGQGFWSPLCNAICFLTQSHKAKEKKLRVSESLYYYCPFSCFSEKILSKAKSYRMRFFASREATTIAEPPEPLTFQHSDFMMTM